MNTETVIVIAALVTSPIVSWWISYGFKRAIADRDQELKDSLVTARTDGEKLKERVNVLETRRVAELESEVAEDRKKRSDIHHRIDGVVVDLGRTDEKVKHLSEMMPEISRISRELSATSATLKSVTEQVSQIAARQYTDAAKVGNLQGKVEAGG